MGGTVRETDWHYNPGLRPGARTYRSRNTREAEPPALGLEAFLPVILVAWFVMTTLSAVRILP